MACWGLVCRSSCETYDSPFSAHVPELKLYLALNRKPETLNPEPGHYCKPYVNPKPQTLNPIYPKA